MAQENSILFTPYKLGGIELKNRVVMAPMTRSRAIGNMANDLIAEYYAQRATAGLIITEGTSPSVNGLGYSRIPGMYSPEHIATWKAVTDAVHANGGKIFMQLMHTGRIGHPLNLPEGGRVMGVSPIAVEGQMWTDTQGMQDHPVPEEITDIPALIAEYVHSAKSALEAGMDGVEIHAANGYLPMQFLNSATNQRTDNYGGSYENRNRFVLELIDAVVAAIGKDKVGIRFSPFNTFNGTKPAAQEAEQYMALATALKQTGIAYVHMLTFAMPATLVDEMHAAFGGTFILNGGYDVNRAAADITAGRAELISFGNHYIANPDLVHRMQTGAELAIPDQSTFYTPGAVGLTDYATMG